MHRVIAGLATIRASIETERAFRLIQCDHLLDLADDRVKRSDIVQIGEDEGSVRVETTCNDILRVLVAQPQQGSLISAIAAEVV